ncbi:MAG: hypothetical protein HKN70_02000 [Gammaproteobacteria bacterium]|nr:hypothetical protein [Gammaproteobacteria bacterium]
MRLFLICTAVLGCLLVAPRSAAIEPLGAAQLKEICAGAMENPDNVESRLCIFYVKGFLDGAVATDGRVAENVVAEIEAQDSFTRRVMRTRVGSRLKQFGPSVYAEFCVGQPDPIADVVLHVIEELDRTDNLERTQAQTVVYSSLRRHYPCVAE